MKKLATEAAEKKEWEKKRKDSWAMGVVGVGVLTICWCYFLDNFSAWI